MVKIECVEDLKREIERQLRQVKLKRSFVVSHNGQDLYDVKAEQLEHEFEFEIGESMDGEALDDADELDGTVEIVDRFDVVTHEWEVTELDIDTVEWVAKVRVSLY